MLKNSKKAEHALLKKLGSIYKTPVDKFEVERVKNQQEEELPFIRVTPPLGKSMTYYCTELTGKTLSLMSLIDPSKFTRSEIKEAMDNMLLYATRESPCLVVYITGTVWVVFDNPELMPGVIVTRDIGRGLLIGIAPLQSFIYELEGFNY